MNIDKATLVWGMFLIQLALLGAMFAFMYYADRLDASRRRPRKAHR